MALLNAEAIDYVTQRTACGRDSTAAGAATEGQDGGPRRSRRLNDQQLQQQRTVCRWGPDAGAGSSSVSEDDDDDDDDDHMDQGGDDNENNADDDTDTDNNSSQAARQRPAATGGAITATPLTQRRFAHRVPAGGGYVGKTAVTPGSCDRFVVQVWARVGPQRGPCAVAATCTMCCLFTLKKAWTQVRLCVCLTECCLGR